MKRILFAVTVATFLTENTIASDTSIVDKWYSALKTSNRTAFSTLIGEDAKIELKSLEIVQTREEFIDALDNWEDASGELTLIRKIKSVTETTASVEVCYRFPSNSFMNLETFEFADSQVFLQIQEKIKDEC